MRIGNASILLGLLTLGAGCGATAIAPGPVDPLDPPPLEAPSRFVGTWLVEETVAHATYFATLYEFGEDGSVTLLEDLSFDAGITYPEVGWAGSRYLVCFFGHQWRSEDDVELEIDGRCTDDETRPIRIAFDPDPSGNSEGVGVRLVSVGGDTQMWSEPGWGWHFIKCEDDRANCTPW